MTPNLLKKYQNAYARKLTNLAVAFHNPKELPKAETETHSMTDDEMEKEAMRLTKALGGIIKE